VWAGRIGATATDTNDIALQKRLAVVLCAGTLPLTVLWSVIYLLVHTPLAAAAPAFYSLFTLVNTGLFACPSGRCFGSSASSRCC
jgi:adenylate cyclase